MLDLIPEYLCLIFPPIMQQNLLTMEQIVSVDDTQIKDKKCILLRIKGAKQFVLQCEVNRCFLGILNELTLPFLHIFNLHYIVFTIHQIKPSKVRILFFSPFV